MINSYSETMKQQGESLSGSASTEAQYLKPMLTELASLTDLTLGGSPANGVDGKDCAPAADQTEPAMCQTSGTDEFGDDPYGWG